MLRLQLIKLVFWALFALPVPILVVILFLRYSKERLGLRSRVVLSVLFLAASLIFWEASLRSTTPWVNSVREVVFNFGLFIAYPWLVIILAQYIKNTILSQKRFGLSPPSWIFTIILTIVGSILSIVYMVLIVSSSKEESVWMGFMLIPILAGIGSFILFVGCYALTFLVETIFRGRSFHPLNAILSLVLLILSYCVLSYSARYAYYMKAAEDPSTSAEQFRIIVKFNDSRFWQTMLAKNPNTSSDVLLELARSKSGYVVGTAASHPNMPVEALVELAKSKSPNVLWGVARNPNTSAETLAELALSKSPDVLTSVAQNPNTPKESLVELSQSTSKAVLMALAGNPNSTLTVLREIAKQPNAQPIRENVSLNKKILLYKNNGIFNALAANENTPLDVLEIISQYSQDNHIGTNLGKHKNSTCEILKPLLKFELERKWKPITRRYNNECVEG